MPGTDGFAVLEALDAIVPAETYLPVLVITADESNITRERALAAGAMDFLGKPFKMNEVLLRMRNLLHTRAMYLQLQDRNARLDGMVRERTLELEATRLDILHRLASAAEFHDDVTGRHTRRVGHAAGLLAAELGLPAAEVAVIEKAAMLHDLGKIGVPDAILLKPGKLTTSEIATMKTHTTIGERLLADSPAPVMQAAAAIALTHHERWDGLGYHGLGGDEIPLTGRITCVVDVFDALTHDRPYRPALPTADVLSLLRRGRGSHFDPRVCDAFLDMIQRTGVASLMADDRAA
jgi:putative two-component system response regulator